MKVIGDCNDLQNDLDKIYDWSIRWQMEFNSGRCKKTEFGKSSKRCMNNHKLGHLLIKPEEKDLGVIFSEDLSPGKQINKIIGETFQILKNIRIAFAFLNEDMMRKIITSMICLRLEYAAIIWSLHELEHIRKLERIQRAAMKMIPELQDQSYKERLATLQLPTLEKRQERGDMIALYRLVNGMEQLDREDLLVFSERDTRGHGRKLRSTTCRRDVKKFSFPHRSIKLWNGLEDKVVVVVCANNIQSFKKRYMKVVMKMGQYVHSASPVRHN